MSDIPSSTAPEASTGKLNGAKQSVKKAGAVAKAQLGKVQEQAASLSVTAKEQLGRTGEKAGELAKTAKTRALTTGDQAVGFAKRKPVTTALAVAGVGVALVFLLSGRARGAALSAGLLAGSRAKGLGLRAKAGTTDLRARAIDLGGDLVKAYRKRF